MYKNGDQCPICGYNEIKEKSITETFEYKGKTTEIKDYIVFECPDCGESFVDSKTIKNTEKIIRDFQRKVDGLLTSDEIKKIRKSLGFTQKDLGTILGGGEKSFARYESGKVTQSKAMDNLIRIIFNMPEAIEVLKNNNINQTSFSSRITYNYDGQNQTHLKIAGE